MPQKFRSKVRNKNRNRKYTHRHTFWMAQTYHYVFIFLSLHKSDKWRQTRSCSLVCWKRSWCMFVFLVVYHILQKARKAHFYYLLIFLSHPTCQILQKSSIADLSLSWNTDSFEGFLPYLHMQIFLASGYSLLDHLFLCLKALTAAGPHCF